MEKTKEALEMSASSRTVGKIIVKIE